MASKVGRRMVTFPFMAVSIILLFDNLRGILLRGLVGALFLSNHLLASNFCFVVFALDVADADLPDDGSR